MDDQLQINPVARIKSEFPTKFGIPRQAGLVEGLRGTVVFEPEYRNPDALRGIEGFPTCGWCGAFMPCGGETGDGRPRCGRPGWGATSGWGSLPPVPPTGPTPWDCPA